MTICGIDGGGSKTSFVLVQDQQEIGRAVSGPGNIHTAGVERVRQSLKDGFASLAGEPDIVCGGFAGAGRPEQARIYASLIQELCPHARVRVTTDAVVSFLGAIGARPGVLLIAGTGSIALARNTRGEFSRAGGWGFLFGDEGSGFWIGREAIRRCLAERESARSEFSRKLAQSLSINSIADAAGAWSAGTIGIPDIAHLATVVFGDYPGEPARSILQDAARELRALVERLRPDAGLEAPISFSGSIASHPIMQELIGIPFAPPLKPPEWGAVLFAQENA